MSRIFSRAVLMTGVLAAATVYAKAPPSIKADDALRTHIHDLVKGNSLAVTNRFGTSLIYFYGNGRYRHVGGRTNVVSEGEWWSTFNSVCVRMTRKQLGRPLPANCMEFEGRKLGDSWSAFSADDLRNTHAGSLLRYRLIQGHPATRR